MARQAGVGHRLSGQGHQSAGGEKIVRRIFAAFTLAALACLASVPAASAVTIERIISSPGIEAWLGRENATPLVAMNYAFHGGSTQDETDKAGTAHLVAGMVDEGAGDLDSKTYHERLARHALRPTLPPGRGYFHRPPP